MLRSVGFGNVIVVGFDPTKAKIGDITKKISHNSFISRIKVWLKITNGPNGWHALAQLQQQFHFTTYLA
jgi:hypothetical protein